MQTKREHTSCSPITTPIACLLLARSRLHAVAGLAEFQGGLLATKADSRQRRTAIAIVPDNGRVAIRGGVQIHHVRLCLGNYVLALQDAHFHIGAATIPFNLVFARLQLGSVHVYGMTDLPAALRRCKLA